MIGQFIYAALPTSNTGAALSKPAMQLSTGSCLPAGSLCPVQAQHGRIAALAELIGSYARLDGQSRLRGLRPLDVAAGRTPLFYAAQHGRIAALEELVGSGASMEARDATRGLTSLHVAADAGQCDSITALVKLGAPMECLSSKGCSPLGSAILKACLPPFSQMTCIITAAKEWSPRAPSCRLKPLLHACTWWCKACSSQIASFRNVTNFMKRRAMRSCCHQAVAAYVSPMRAG